MHNLRLVPAAPVFFFKFKINIKIDLNKKDLKKDVVPRTKDVAAVPAVVAPFSQRESDAAFGASLGRVVAQPMVGH